MAPTTTTPSQPRRGAHRLGLAAIGLITAAALIAVPTAAQAHHGWDGFETSNLIYISGTVSSDGDWGDPHSHFDIAVDSEIPASTPEELQIPEELSGPEDSVRVQAALAYDGPHDELEIIIAPPWWSSNNGLDRSLEVGERFQGVGYINSTDGGLFRPVAFWYGDGSSPVNQVIGNTLPVRAPLPGEESTGGETEVPSTIEDPTEMENPEQEAVADESQSASDSGSSAWVVWAVFGAVAVVIVAGGVFYVRRRTRQTDGQDPDA
ncbi:hypothetical protein BW730_01650 [Tessaracoccus aquimaris]|uniref:Uncharacterized protein n=1 Tax=Tessaracoccus aquimaris TaxID=1332264 RepID=A0A1Q2CK15_9ACTN|nr:hypothetical protein [Tessaracoccus aquimaris]AQP46451.1 hypothetical protein BW730_01650 [Tessaracoccus aquimaris]